MNLSYQPRLSIKKLKLRGLSPRENYTDHRLLAKLVLTFADIGCHVVSVTDPYGRILGFLDRKALHSVTFPISSNAEFKIRHFIIFLALMMR
jgi:hypothetical protein